MSRRAMVNRSSATTSTPSSFAASTIFAAMRHRAGMRPRASRREFPARPESPCRFAHAADEGLEAPGIAVAHPPQVPSEMPSVMKSQRIAWSRVGQYLSALNLRAAIGSTSLGGNTAYPRRSEGNSTLLKLPRNTTDPLVSKPCRPAADSRVPEFAVAIVFQDDRAAAMGPCEQRHTLLDRHHHAQRN